MPRVARGRDDSCPFAQHVGFTDTGRMRHDAWNPPHSRPEKSVVTGTTTNILSSNMSLCSENILNAFWEE